MIAQLRGIVESKSENSLLLDVNGVGYEIYALNNDLEQLPIGETATMATYFSVKESSQELFGFIDPRAKALFSKLISVSGVGPRVAMSILSLGEAAAISTAIAQSDSQLLTSASGVGRRVAEKIVVELKEKVDSFSVSEEHNKISDDALQALIALGYSASESRTALSQIANDLPVESRVTAALKVMAGQ